nr:MAG TPA: hypothetical protein [Caudoviricetes sp.]
MHDIRLEMEELERLTFKGNFCDIAQCRELSCPYGGSCSHKKVWERLKAYEETGLSPIACAQAAEAERLLSDAGVQLERIIEIVKADKDGRVVVMPVRPALTTVISSLLYVIEDGEIYEDALYEAVVAMSSNGNTNVTYTTLSEEMIFEQADIGKTVFLTREEAEKAMEVMKDG